MDKYLEEARQKAGSRSTEPTVKVLTDNGYSKSTIARLLLERGLSVSAVSKAVPMAYSQAHSIWKTMVPTGQAKASLAKQPARHPRQTLQDVARATVPTRREQQAAYRRGQTKVETELGRRPATKSQPKVRPGIGKLRTPGLPSDIQVGACINCGYDLVVRPLATGYAFIHVNASAEEYLATLQFCTAVPKSLVP